MAARKKPEELRSHRWLGVNDLRAFGHRSRLRQIGYDAEDWNGRPVIGIINTWSDINQCHAHLRDRVEDVIRGRAGAQRLAVTSGGTIPDRGLFGVFLPDGTRVGELDEEMVYESRPGETFLLGASTWRIEEITFERVVVTPAPGEPGRMPFWHGDGPGRPFELGMAVGEFLRTTRGDEGRDALVAELGLDPA